MEENYTMAKKKVPTDGEIMAKEIIAKYKPKTVADMQNALKDIFGPMFEAMLNGEMDNHLGYSNNDHSAKSTTDRRNGYIEKSVRTSQGAVDLKVPRDRDGSFEPQVIPKRSRDVSGIEDKVLAMYARGMSQRDIASTIDDIYGFTLSAEKISDITDRVLDELSEWQNRRLGSNNPFGVILATLIGVPMYADIFGTIPVAEALFAKGAQLGVILSFMMAVTTLSLPSMIMLRKAIKPKLLALFIAICTIGIIIIGYLFNAFQALIV